MIISLLKHAVFFVLCLQHFRGARTETNRVNKSNSSLTHSPALWVLKNLMRNDEIINIRIEPL